MVVVCGGGGVGWWRWGWRVREMAVDGRRCVKAQEVESANLFFVGGEIACASCHSRGPVSPGLSGAGTWSVGCVLGAACIRSVLGGRAYAAGGDVVFCVYDFTGCAKQMIFSAAPFVGDASAAARPPVISCCCLRVVCSTRVFPLGVLVAQPISP